MEPDELVAPSEATEEIVTETPETPEVAPATEAETPEQTESQKRRERRKAEQQRLQEANAAAEAKLAETNARLARVQAAAAGMQEPKLEDYSDIAMYYAAMGAYQVSKARDLRDVSMVAAEAEQAKQATEQVRAAHIQVRQAELADEVQDARKRYVDFDAALAVAQDARFVSPALSDMVLMADQPADLAYHLGKNPDVAVRLSGMPPQAMAFELGRIAASMQVPQPKIASNAPPPISPVKPGGTPSKDPTKMSANEFAAWRAAGGTFT